MASALLRPWLMIDRHRLVLTQTPVLSYIANFSPLCFFFKVNDWFSQLITHLEIDGDAWKQSCLVKIRHRINWIVRQWVPIKPSDWTRGVLCMLICSITALRRLTLVALSFCLKVFSSLVYTQPHRRDGGGGVGRAHVINVTGPVVWHWVVDFAVFVSDHCVWRWWVV